MPRRFLYESLRELESDRALQLYGACLAVAHGVALLHWVLVDRVARILGPDSTPVCWPFFEDCAVIHRVPGRAWSVLLAAYGALSVAALWAWTTRKTRLGWFTTLGLAIFNVVIVAMDYRLRLNQHLMLLWTGLVFLAVPDKRWSLRVLLVGFYVWAGILKLNAEWLSGEALLGRLPLFVPERLVPAACTYVVVLELGMAFGLLSSRRWMLAATLAQLAAFHVASWTVVGFFYPVLMLALLGIAPLAHFIPAAERSRLRAPIAVAVAFSAFQLVPLLFPGDPALTGRGRGVALHMFDAPVACRAVAVLHEHGKAPLPMAMTGSLPARIACDPLVYWNFARAMCRERAASPLFDDLDLVLDSRKGRRGRVVRVVEIPRFCASGTTYAVFGPNAWIRGE